MPNLNPGIKPLIGSGRRFVFLLASVFFPFLLFAQPVINSIAPLSGPVGTAITITGNNFSVTPGNNIVYIGAVKAAVTAASVTSLTVTVPAGTSYQPVTVTTGGLTAWSAQPFNVTFSAGPFTSLSFFQTTLTTSSSPIGICSKDLDGDGKPDLAVIQQDNHALTIFGNNSTTGVISFVSPPNYTLDVGNQPQAIAVGDLDGDGKPDIVVSGFNFPNLYVYRNTSTTGAISFDAAVPYASTNQVTGIDIADLNGDGKAEIATTSSNDNLLSTYTNNSTPGTINFSAKADLTLPPGSVPLDIVITDLDKDGKPDLACENSLTALVSVFHNTSSTGGAVSFDLNHQDFPTGNNPMGLAAADMDGDGKTDLVVANNLDMTVTLLKNNSSSGNINMVPEATAVSTGIFPVSLVINDLDGDGKPDVTVSDSYGTAVSVHRNTSSAGTLSLDANVDYATGPYPWYLTSADLDGDGRPDIAVVDNTNSDITILRNRGANEPAVTSFTPDTGGAGTLVTITGINLNGASGVTFGDEPASSFTAVSPTTVTAVVANGASGAVTVTTPNGYAYKEGFTFAIVAPDITSISPQSGSTGTTVTIEGTALSSATSVNFGGVAAASWATVSDTKILAVVGAGATGSVMVTTPGGTATGPAFNFLATPPPPPAITIFSPTSGSPNTDITITGTNFTGITGVTFGGTPALSFDVTGNTIHAIVGEGSSGEVSVIGANGTASLAGFTFTATPPPPAKPQLTSFSPQNASLGTTVTIQGNNLSGITSLTFGGVPSAAYTIVSDVLVQAVVGTGATGQLKVTNSTGADSLAGFVFVQDTTEAPPPGLFQLVQFSGALNNNQPRLNWQTRNDGGISSYVLERGVDGSLFSAIGTVPVNTKVGANHNYTFTDLNPKNGINYYRLKILDTLAHYSYSPTLSLQATAPEAVLVIYPNPVKYGFFLVDLPIATNASRLQLTDLSGRIILTQVITAGTLQQRINVPGLIRGTYRLSWTDGTHKAYRTILIL